MTFRIYIAAILLFALPGGCRKEEAPDPIPVIEFIAISDEVVESFSNAVRITVRYRDGDGDLGSPDPDDNTLRVRDARLPGDDWYHLPPLTPDLQPLNIEGTFEVELNPLFILGNGLEEVTSFTLQVRDRAGNWSNQISTPQVRIVEGE